MANIVHEHKKVRIELDLDEKLVINEEKNIVYIYNKDDVVIEIFNPSKEIDK